jgi:hypothetical protein
MAARLAERSCIERFADVHFESQFVKHSNDKIIRLAAYNNVVSEHPKLSPRTTTWETHELIHRPNRTREYDGLEGKSKTIPHRTNHIQDNLATVWKDGALTAGAIEYGFCKAVLKGPQNQLPRNAITRTGKIYCSEGTVDRTDTS